MTEKRFTELISSIDYYTIWDNKEDKGLTVEDAVDLLNEQHEENTMIKQTIKDAIRTERTNIGKSVLKQLMDRIQ